MLCDSDMFAKKCFLLDSVLLYESAVLVRKKGLAMVKLKLDRFVLLFFLSLDLPKKMVGIDFWLLQRTCH